MFQLFDLIITSPVGVFLLSAFENAIFAVLVVSECADCGFEDLGKLLFGGLILALAVGIGLSVLVRKMKERDSANREFVSIRATKPDEQSKPHANH